MGMREFSYSMQMRDTIEKLVKEQVDRQRPRYRYAKVESIDRDNYKCSVIFNGETGSVLVNMGSIQPSAVDQIVRVEGIGTDKYISDVLGIAVVKRSIDDENYARWQCTSTTRPTSPNIGYLIYETDTQFDRRWDGARWEIERYHGNGRGNANDANALPAFSCDHVSFTPNHGVDTMVTGWPTVMNPTTKYAGLFTYINDSTGAVRVNEKGKCRFSVSAVSDLGQSGRSSLTGVAPTNASFGTLVDTRHRLSGFAGAGYLEQILEATVQVQPGDKFGARILQSNGGAAAVGYHVLMQVQYI